MRVLVVAAALAVAAAVMAADYVVEKPPAGRAEPLHPGGDGELELTWDNGTRQWGVVWYTGAGAWVGNDFDISTLGGSWWIKTIKVMSSNTWPNGAWDGFRLGVYTFSGGMPGSLLYGPRFVQGSGAGYTWCGFDFGMWSWSLGGHTRFVVAMEQYYNYPGCDPYALDTNGSFMRRSWQYYGGRWEPLVGAAGYRNLMLRVVISDLMAVAPASLGRVKALYY